MLLLLLQVLVRRGSVFGDGRGFSWYPPFVSFICHNSIRGASVTVSFFNRVYFKADFKHLIIIIIMLKTVRMWELTAVGVLLRCLICRGCRVEVEYSSRHIEVPSGDIEMLFR